jgi:hypothetical protein
VKESAFDKMFVKYLKSKGCVVFKLTPGVGGIPIGVSDRVFFKEGFYGFAELKKSAKAPFQPLQKEFLEKMDEWSWAKAVYPENFEEIKKELDLLLMY